MFKKITIFFLAICMLASLGKWNIASAFTPEENIQESKVKFDQLNSEILDLNSKVSSLNVELEKLNTTLKDNEAQIKETEDEIESNTLLIVQTEEELDKSQDILDKRVRAMYKSNISSNLFVTLLTSTSIFDLFDKINSMSKIVSVDKAIMEDINAKKTTLNETVEILNGKQADLLTLKASTEESLRLIEEKKAEEQVAIDNLEKEKSSVFAVIEENEKTLVANPISVINSSNTVSEIQNAVNDLNGLIPQLNSSNVIASAQEAISTGQAKIQSLSGPATPSRGDSISGSTGEALQTLTMESTAYTGGYLTATGLKPVRNPGGISTIAVDPNVIPLGSKVYVHGYGTAIASDTGGAIKGNIIDVYFNSLSECTQWGRRNVTVDILAYPNEW